MANRTNNFEPKDGLLRVPIHVLNDIFTKGWAYMTLPTGQIIKLTKDDLLFKEEEIKKLENILEKKKLDKLKNDDKEKVQC